MTATGPRLRIRRFGLRQLLVFVAVLAIFFEFGAALFRRAAQQDAAIAAVQEESGRVELTYSGPAWLNRLGISHLRRRVVGLTFAGANYDEAACVRLSILAKFSDLQWLDLDVVPIDDEGAGHVAALKHLQKLTFNNSTVTEVGFAKLAALGDLQELNISECPVDNGAIRQLASLPHLRRLLLRRAIIRSSLPDLNRLRGLERLDLADCNASADLEGLHDWLGHLDSLEELYLQDWRIKTGDIEGISRLKALRLLDLTGCEITSNELKLLAALPRLEYLGLAPEAIDDDAIRILKSFSSLRKLSIHPGRILRLKGKADSSDITEAEFLAMLNGTGSGTAAGEANSHEQSFFELQLSKVTRALPNVNIVTADPRYPGIRGAAGTTVLNLPELVDEKESPSPPSGGVF